jgi:hypothetical protein
MAWVPAPASADKKTPVNEYEPLNTPLPLKKLTCAPPSRYFLAADADLTTYPTKVVRIFVGPDRKQWVLPEQLLCDRVEYFQGAFQSGFRESNEKVLEFPEDLPAAFGYIIDRIFGDPRPPTKNFGKSQDDRQMAWCKLYVLADLLGCSNLVDAEELCRQELWDLRSECLAAGRDMPIISPAAAKFLYQNTRDSAELRLIFAEYLAGCHLSRTVLNAPQLERWLESATSHPQFHFDVMAEVGNHFRTSVEECIVPDCRDHNS